LVATSGVGAPRSAQDVPPAPRVFRLPLAVRLLSLFGVAFIGAVSALMFAFTVVVLIIDQWISAVFIALCTAIMAALTHYTARDLVGKWNLRIVLGADSVELFLPKNRSLIHATARQRLAIPYADIAAIETRLEAYTSFGMGFLQQPYVLRRKNGELIYLFEERAIGTGLQSSYFAALVQDLVARAGVGVRDLGMAEGGGGVLGVWGTHAADWAAPALSRSRQYQLMRKAANTGALAFLLINLAFIARALFRLL
jgi:hypothetical protein